MLWLLENSEMLESANRRSTRTVSTHTAENVKQVLNVGKGIDELVNDFGKRVLQRVIVNGGEVKVHRYVTKVIVVKFL